MKKDTKVIIGCIAFLHILNYYTYDIVRGVDNTWENTTQFFSQTKNVIVEKIKDADASKRYDICCRKYYNTNEGFKFGKCARFIKEDICGTYPDVHYLSDEMEAYKQCVEHQDDLFAKACEREYLRIHPNSVLHNKK